MPTTSSDLLSALNWRYAVKKFDPARKVAPETIAALEKAATLSASSYGLQPWRFLVITNPEIRQKLRAASWNQPQITDASHLFVFCRKIEVTPADVDRFIDRVSAVRGVPKAALEDYRKMMVGSVSNPPGLPGGDMTTWTRSQTYIALGTFLTSAAMLGVDACPMEGFDPKGYDAILNVSKDGYMPVVLAAVGYRAADDMFSNMAKVRFDVADVVKHI